MKKCIFITMLILSGTLLLTGCSNKQEVTMEQKVDSELSYLSVELIEMLNSLNNISLNKFKLNVENLKEDAEEKDSSKSGETGTEGSKNDKSSSGGERLRWWFRQWWRTAIGKWQ